MTKRKAAALSVWLYTHCPRLYRRKSTSLNDRVWHVGMPPSKIFLMPLDCYFFPSGISNPRYSYQQAPRLYTCTLYHIALFASDFLASSAWSWWSVTFEADTAYTRFDPWSCPAFSSISMATVIFISVRGLFGYALARCSISSIKDLRARL
ncbi:hypothetical protein HBI56_134160 [Parastagonospora nodorum]|uniref:Uncharacterized protein n=1 Tax=Phaeosphaeria nodorum (strain SN15 / ATCC MYA-4574 / FGSC 10173) TaxID=321614 RepID=A0A7U2FBL9_PHANO|nr:hypothetical protein HBH56_037260 [Parastagonospora nodorum]QRC99964.1 hypothetical protein JI435_414320 [Parastagonospora nodorum SN15]KAH3933626.1 hypothetical protein HBH54_062210 [Parastagonospora nodorum]KAH3952359.1 hypothetical protein HBH53_047910 [Parastagonospora nodorum]KAH3979728.1 hypothetical protein HBH51_058910 [Parastagonospora nodorum]